MSIIGLTDQTAAFPIIGTLRKGEKKTKENAPGKDLTYLRFVSDDALANRMFNDAYPDENALRTINVFLPHKTTDENMDAWIEEWVAGGLVHRCDGQTQVLWRTPSGGYSTEHRPCQNCKGKQVGRLSVIIPELGRFATVTIMTTSKHDIKNLTRQLRGYEALQGGDLRGVPFVITRRKFSISTPAPGGKRARREKWLLSIETQPHWTIAKLTAMERAALPEGEIIDDADYKEVHQLPSGISNPFEDEPEVEFEPAPDPAPAPAPVQPVEPKVNSSTPKARPALEPHALKEVLEKKVAKSNLIDLETKDPLPIELHPFGNNAAKLVSAKFQLALDESSLGNKGESIESMYHTCLNWLFGKTSAKDLTAAQGDALLDWLLNGNKGQMFNAAIAAPAPEEAQRIYRQAMLDQGQIDMFDTPEAQADLDEFFGPEPSEVAEEIDF